MLIAVMTVLLLQVLCLAQSPDPTAAGPSGAISSPSLTAVSGAVDKIPSTVPTWLLAVFAFLGELALRFWPTAKPQSMIMYAGMLFGLLGVGLTKISKLFDLFAQNVKDPEPAQKPNP